MTDDYPGRERRDDWDTSHEAAESQAQTAARVRAIVLQAHRDNPAGLTDDELFALVNADGRYGESSPRKRRGELVEDGELVATTLRRPSNKGKQMVVWIAVHPDHVRKPPPKPVDQPTMIAAIVETLQDKNGAGSDLYSVGDETEGPEPWLYVYGNIDIGHLANVVLDAVKEGAKR